MASWWSSPNTQHLPNCPSSHIRAPSNNYNNSKDDWSRITRTNIIMKKPEILNYKNVTETQSEQVLLEKWCQWTCAKQGCHKTSVCKKYSIFEVQVHLLWLKDKPLMKQKREPRNWACTYGKVPPHKGGTVWSKDRLTPSENCHSLLVPIQGHWKFSKAVRKARKLLKTSS